MIVTQVIDSMPPENEYSHSNNTPHTKKRNNSKGKAILLRIEENNLVFGTGEINDRPHS